MKNCVKDFAEVYTTRSTTYLNIDCFSAIFDTKQSKDDVIGVIVTPFWICLLLPLRDFVP